MGNRNVRADGQNERTLSELFEGWGRGVALLDHINSGSWRGEYELRGLSLRVPQAVGGEWLTVVKAFSGDGTPVVAFHSAHSAAEALAGAVSRMADGSLSWKADQFYGRQ
jgi:hypothetical protein